MVRIIHKRKIWLSIALLMVIVGVASLSLWKLKLGIDFTGGSLLEVSYSKTVPTTSVIESRLKAAGIQAPEVKLSGEKGALMRFQTADETTHQKIVSELKKDDENLSEKSFESVGPVIGSELKAKSLWAIALALLMILVYITFVFRKVSYPVASWKYGVSAIIALFHDLIFVLGIFAFLGHYKGVEITSSFIPAFLTVLGFSVHDTIVVFDRIRENLMKYNGDFFEIVHKSLNETLTRSINTSLTVLLVLAALYLFGGETLKTFSLALLLGIAIGTFSSIFVASPLLVFWHELTSEKKA